MANILKNWIRERPARALDLACFNPSMVLVSTGSEKGQEESRRIKDERTMVLNPTSCGHQIG
jgi:hypothetical protein